MAALDSKASHVPYRNSKLTHLLQTAVGGNARTAMVCTVGPSAFTAAETHHSLRFASRVKRIDLSVARKVIAHHRQDEECRQLKRDLFTLEALRTSLARSSAAREEEVALEQERRTRALDEMRISHGRQCAAFRQVGGIGGEMFVSFAFSRLHLCLFFVLSLRAGVGGAATTS
jgi:hypothetical protein